MSPRLRPARPSDARACAEILREWAAETPWYPNDDPPEARPARVAERLTAGQGIVAECGGVAGFVLLEDNYLACLYVARSARGQGLGARLLDAAKARAEALIVWTHAANSGARAFYEREGFVLCGTSDGDNAEGLPDVAYLWRKGAGG